MKHWLAPLAAGTLLLVPALGSVAMADTTAPTTAAGGAATAGAGGQLLLDSAVLGDGVIKDTQGAVALFHLRAGPTARSPHGGNFSWVEQDGSEGYNGAIRGYSIQGGTATITGGGPLFDKDGSRRQVRFTVTITPGGAGTATMNMSFSGRDFSMQCQDTVQTGLIAVAPLDSSILTQLKSGRPAVMPELRQGLEALRQGAQPQPAKQPSAASPAA